jgi:methionyl-tRNA formyltransferase
MRTVLIHHSDSLLSRDVVAPWLGSFSTLAGVVVVHEPTSRRRERIRRELRRSGPVRFVDVLAFRLYYGLRLRKHDLRWEERQRAELSSRFPPLPPDLPRLDTSSPNSPDVQSFLSAARPDLMLARSRVLLDESIFSIPALGTFVMHPGITPEYRNSHGCFWALANRDLDRVGLTLLRIDAGVDTGPVFGYFTYPYDELRESHEVIQQRMVLENLDALRDRLLEIESGQAARIDVSGRESGAWGQPRLTKYLRWKQQARKAARAGQRPRGRTH